MRQWHARICKLNLIPMVQGKPTETQHAVQIPIKTPKKLVGLNPKQDFYTQKAIDLPHFSLLETVSTTPTDVFGYLD